MHRQFMSSWNPEEDTVSRAFDALLMVTTIAFPFSGLVVSSHYIPFSHWSSYAISVLPSNYQSTPFKIVYGVWWFLFLQIIWAILLIGAFFVLTTARHTWLLLGEFHCGRKLQNVRMKTSSELRKIETIRFKYRILEVLHLKLTLLWREFILPLESLILMLGIFGNFTLITYSEILTPLNAAIILIWVLVATSFVILGLNFGGALYTRGCEVLGSMKNNDWGSRTNNKIMKKFVKSCRPIQIGYGRMYAIRKLSVLKYLRTLTKGTMRVLLTLKKYST
ncbi:unnamed protein product [Orchesella dallaii]|uniref:Uncharacterized protein n=1 Tax=Orchesella dallaii TaxID=48710 RepID=A0ABP1S3W5_9HEXA